MILLFTRTTSVYTENTISLSMISIIAQFESDDQKNKQRARDAQRKAHNIYERVTFMTKKIADGNGDEILNHSAKVEGGIKYSQLLVQPCNTAKQNKTEYRPPCRDAGWARTNYFVRSRTVEIKVVPPECNNNLLIHLHSTAHPNFIPLLDAHNVLASGQAAKSHGKRSIRLGRCSIQLMP